MTGPRALLFEAVTMAVVFILAYHTRRLHCAWWRTAERRLGQITRRRWLPVTLVGMLALGGSATQALLRGIPEAAVHDEFSYLLAADTFAHGRLSNPTHPMWVHFESFHIMQQPTYASKYPPTQGLMLAGGQVIGGHPIIGVWISTGLACAAICWMLLAWLPSWWAVLGGLLAALHPGMLLDWSQCYWGGTVAATGGALVFGALRRIMRWSRVRDALLMGVGLAVLANSRPYEGLLISVPVAAVLIAWMVGKSGPAVRVSIKRIVLPICVVLALTGGAMGFYNWRVTGDALRLPYQVHEATYNVAPLFLWQHTRPEPTYRHKVMRDFHTGWELSMYRQKHSVRGLVQEGMRGGEALGRFYLGGVFGFRYLPFVLTIPLLMLPWMVRNPWSRFALLTCGVLMVGLFLESWPVRTHYTAPVTGLVCVLLLQLMRHLRLWCWRGWPLGRCVVWAIFIICIASFMVAFVHRIWWSSAQPSQGWTAQRARILAQLEKDGGYHLVIVRYGPRHSPHNEWVYNGADIDSAKVVWAREMDMAQNRTLLEYFKDRHVWLVEPRVEFPPKLVPYWRALNSGGSP